MQSQSRCVFWQQRQSSNGILVEFVGLNTSPAHPPAAEDEVFKQSWINVLHDDLNELDEKAFVVLQSSPLPASSSLFQSSLDISKLSLVMPSTKSP